METELPFSKSILKDDSFSLLYYTQTSFMWPIYFYICRAIVTHLDQWIIIELQIEKSIHNNASFR